MKARWEAYRAAREMGVKLIRSAYSTILREARELFERDYLSSQLARFGGNISRTAGFVGMERSALHRKLKSIGIFADEHSR